MARISLIIFLILTSLASCSHKPTDANDNVVQNYLTKINSVAISDTLRLKYVDSLYNYAIIDKNDSLNRTVLFEAIRAYFILNQNEKFLLGSRQLFQLSAIEMDSLLMAKSLYCIGDYYEDTQQLDSAYLYYSKSENLFKNTDNAAGIGKAKLYKAGILYEVGIFTESEIQTANALQYLIKSDNERLIYEAYNLMGLNLTELYNYDEALRYFNLALKQLDAMEQNNYSKEKLIISRASIHNNTGNLFVKKEKFSQAIVYYNKGLAVPLIKANYPSLHAMLLDNLAYAKMMNHSTGNLEALFLKAAKIRDSLQIKSGIVSSKIHLGEYYLQTNDTIKGIALLKDGYTKAKEIESNYDIKNVLKLLSSNDKKNGDYYTKLYIKVNDSLQNIERNTRNKFARIAFETNQIEKINETLIKKYSSTVVFFSIALLLITTVFIVYRLRSKNIELQLIQDQQESNEKIYQLILQQTNLNQLVREEERNRIAAELHDGIVNRIHTTRYNLMSLQPEDTKKKELLIQELINAETEIRKTSHDLQQNLVFDDTSFQQALSALVANQTNDFNTVFDFSIDKYIDWSAIPSEHKVHIYRITQEAFQNVNKYAQAPKCYLFIVKKGLQISLKITDNGIGFEQNRNKPGIGLTNIAQRVKKMNGTLNITSSSEGTTIEVLF